MLFQVKKLDTKHYIIYVSIDMKWPEKAKLPSGSNGKEPACNGGDLGSISGLGRYPEGGHGNPLQYSCLENPMDKGAWWATVNVAAKSQTQLSN